MTCQFLQLIRLWLGQNALLQRGLEMHGECLGKAVTESHPRDIHQTQSRMEWDTHLSYLLITGGGVVL